MTEKDALQAALAGEHAAMYGVGVAGGKLSGARFAQATAAFEEHRRRRDQLTDLVTQIGATPVAAEPAYDLPQPVTDAASATALVLLTERRLSVVYADLVEAAEQTPVRTLAIQALIATSRTQLTWGGTAQAFPGQS